jgi:hypothetical protein
MGIFDNKQSAGEPLANANARKGIANNRTPRESIVDVTAMPMPMQSRVATPDDPDHHYHWFGIAEARIHYAQALGYEYVPAEKGGDPASIDDARKTTGLVLMRVPRKAYEERKAHLRLVKNPARERAPRESFKSQAAKLGVKSVDETTTSRGTMSSALANDD